MDWGYFVENFHFVSLGWAFILPVSLEILDFLTGYINACLRGERDSSKMRQGGGKKFGELVCLLLAQLFTWAMGLPVATIYMVSLYITFMEFISIIENVKKLGVKIPDKDDLKPDEKQEDTGWEMEHSAAEDDEQDE